MADLKLPKQYQLETFRLAHAAVSIVDEEDLPSVARTLLRVAKSEGNRTNIDNPSVKAILKLRESCMHMNPSTELLIVQVFHQSWMNDSKIAFTFLSMLRGSIIGMSTENIATTLSSLDVSILLLLIVTPSYRTDAQWYVIVNSLLL